MMNMVKKMKTKVAHDLLDGKISHEDALAFRLVDGDNSKEAVDQRAKEHLEKEEGK